MTSPDHPLFAERDFRKASYSTPDQSCVAVARRGDRVAMRDDKVAFGAPADHHLHFTASEFAEFLTAVRRGDFSA
ncbi:hypothetical protein BJF78_33220 [Pseudonocardia sp. CNS-139]|nr:hypothetical protein BJF78_33220 [Pseudonocardia sp. CNS-139]